jgi:hypothetical protein
LDTIPHDCLALSTLPPELQEEIVEIPRRVADRVGTVWNAWITALPASRWPGKRRPWPRIALGQGEDGIVVCVAARHFEPDGLLFEWAFNPVRVTVSYPDLRDPRRATIERHQGDPRGIQHVLDLLEIRWSGGGRRRLEDKPEHPWRIFADQAIEMLRAEPFLTLDIIVERLNMPDEQGGDRTKTLRRWIKRRTAELRGNPPD